MRLLAPTLALLALAPLAFAEDAESDVRIVNFLYDPSPHFVDLADSVRFTNEDADPHTATCDTPGCFFDTPVLGEGESASVTVPLAGTVTYYCIVHPDMTGKLYVGSLVASDADLAIVSLESRREPLAGTPLPDATTAIVSARVVNAGPLATPATDARFTYVNALDEVKAIGDADVPALAPGESATIEVAWLAAPPVGSATVTVRVDLFNTIPESGEANNARSEALAVGLL